MTEWQLSLIQTDCQSEDIMKYVLILYTACIISAAIYGCVTKRFTFGFGDTRVGTVVYKGRIIRYVCMRGPEWTYNIDVHDVKANKNFLVPKMYQGSCVGTISGE